MQAHLRRPKRLASIAVIAAASLLTAACGGDGDSESDSTSVTIWTSVDDTILDGWRTEMDTLAKDEGITVKFESVDSIDKLIKTKIQAGDVPDIAIVPQPGVVASIVELGAAFPLDDVLDMDTLEGNMVPGTLEAGQVDGETYGLLTSMNVKSLLMYPKVAFDKAGYKVPTTIDEMNALADQIRSDGGTPWCLTMESGDATGWVATDWFEDLIMRYGGADVYRQWVTNEVKFDSEVVREAAAEFEEVAFTDGNVLGGREAIAATPFADAARPMFDKAGPSCWLLKQGSFFAAPDFLPEEIFADLDNQLGVAAFPPVEAGGENPVLGGGDLAVLMNDSDAAEKAINLLAETSLGNTAATNTSFISPHTDFDTSLYPNKTTTDIASVAYDATDFLFDGSDAMPAVVGAGSFWKEMTAWISEQTSLDDALANIDASWPAS